MFYEPNIPMLQKVPICQLFRFQRALREGKKTFLKVNNQEPSWSNAMYQSGCKVVTVFAKSFYCNSVLSVAASHTEY